MKKNKTQKRNRIIATLVIIAAIITIFIFTTNVFNRKNITFVSYQGTISNNNLNDKLWSGLKTMWYKTNTSYIENKDSKDLSEMVKEAVHNKSDLIILNSFLIQDKIYDIVSKNKDTMFIVIDYEYENNLENLCVVNFKSYEASFLAGYIAAKKTSSNVVGFIGSIEDAITSKLEKGFVAGVRFSNQSCNTVSTYTNSENDKEKGKESVRSLISIGTDIIFESAGLSGKDIIDEVILQDKYAISTIKDQSYLAKKNIITSVVINVDIAIKDVVNDYIKGKDISKKTYSYDISNNGVKIIEDKNMLGKDLMKEINTLKQKITNKEIDLKKLVFESKIYN